jgi:hypothetical protein
VNFQGKPLPNGIVQFYGPDGKPAAAGDIFEGNYTAPKVPYGVNKVTVTTNAGPAGPGSLPPAPSAGLGNMPGSAAPVAIPAKYKDPEQSGLSVDVKSGRQTYNIDLQ